MPIYIQANQQTSGPYEESAVAAWLHAGQLSPEALACWQGANLWQPLRDIFLISMQHTAPATRQQRIAAALSVDVQEQPQRGICEKCGQHEGDVYCFYYGKKVRGSTRMVSYTSNKYVTSYHMTGRRDVAICDECLGRRRTKSLISSGVMVAVGALVGLGGLLLGAKIGARAPLPLCLVAPGLLFALIGLPGLSNTLSSKNANYGLEIILALKQGELQRQGFDTFWGPAKFRRSQQS